MKRNIFIAVFFNLDDPDDLLVSNSIGQVVAYYTELSIFDYLFLMLFV